MKMCTKCNSERGLIIYHYDKKAKRKRFICRECNRRKLFEYRKTDKGKEAVKKARDRQRDLLHPNRHKIGATIHNRIKRGTIIKPNKCSLCENTVDIHAHHTDYSRPLYIIWVCRDCHVAIHNGSITYDISTYMYDYAKIKSMNQPKGGKARNLSFRANEEDMGIIEALKEKEGGDIRKVTDSDVLRYGLSLIKKELIGEKKNIKKINTQDGVIPNVVPQVDFSIEMVKTNDDSEDYLLTPEEKEKGYQFLKGELCDSNGFPIEQDGNLIVRGGEVYATEPRKEELKAIAAENAAKIVKETPQGKMNEAMVEVLNSSDKLLPKDSEIAEHHSHPGMLATFDGVDAEINEDNFLD